MANKVVKAIEATLIIGTMGLESLVLPGCVTTKSVKSVEEKCMDTYKKNIDELKKVMNNYDYQYLNGEIPGYYVNVIYLRPDDKMVIQLTAKDKSTKPSNISAKFYKIPSELTSISVDGKLVDLFEHDGKVIFLYPTATGEVLENGVIISTSCGTPEQLTEKEFNQAKELLDTVISRMHGFDIGSRNYIAR